MKRLLFLCAAPLAVASLAQAQLNPIWTKYYNPANADDFGLGSDIDGAGNIYMSGSATNAAGVGEIFLSKFSPNGAKLWTRTYSGGGGGPDWGWKVEVDPAGNAIVAGDSVGIGTGYDLVTLKYDPAGNLLWAQRYNGPGNGEDGVFAGHGLGVDALGNVIVGGYSTGAGTGYDWLVVKYSPGGTLLWEERINGPANSHDDCWGIAVDTAGNIYAGGDITDVSGDILVIKYDANGSILWQDQYDGPAGGQDWFYYLDVDSNGNLALAGSSDGIGAKKDYVTLAYDANGVQLFAQRYDGPASQTDWAFAVAISDAGYVATTGLSDNDVESSAATVLYDLSGNLLWAQRYDEESYYYGHDEGDLLQFDANGDLFLVASGWSGPEAGNNNSVVKYSVAGLVLETFVQDGPLHGDEYGGWSFSLDGSGNFYLPCASQRGKRHLDATLLKLGPGAPLGTAYNGQMEEEDPVLGPPTIAPATHSSPREFPYRPGLGHRLPSGLRMARE